MGSGMSSLARLRKAVLIRAYNLRASDQTLIDQFMPFTYQKEGQGLYISIHHIKKCLKMDSPEYKWIEEVLQAVFSLPTSPPTQKPSELYFYDFIQFLETGKAPNTFADEPNKPPDGRKKSFPSNGSNTSSPLHSHRLRGGAEGERGKDSPNRLKKFPPIPPSEQDPGNNYDNYDEEGKEARNSSNDVIEINLSKVKVSSLPESVKLHDPKSEAVPPSHNQEETLEVIVRPVGGGRMPLGVKAGGRALWRKREVMKQERSVHYTTIDDEGGLQELVEKETTQTEILHMECRETGEFAHRELTEFEQIETFNDEVVNAVRGNEEYVHLKSLDDEFHYMDSNMPPKEEKEGNNLDGREEYQRVESPQRPPDATNREEQEQEHNHDAHLSTAEGIDSAERDRHHHTGDSNQFTSNRNEEHLDDEHLNPPIVQSPLGHYAVPPDRYSPMSRQYDPYFRRTDDQDGNGTVAPSDADEDRELELDHDADGEEVVLQEPVSFSRTSPSEVDPLNSTIRKSFMSTHSSYQSLHEID